MLTIELARDTGSTLTEDGVERVLRSLDFTVTGSRPDGYRMGNDAPSISCTTTCSCGSPRKPK